MHVFVLGGTGRTGQCIVDEALTLGYTVSVMTRNPSKAAAKSGLTIAKGDPYNQEDVQSWFANEPKPDAVLSALNAMASDNPFGKYTSPEDLMTKANAHVIAEMKSRGVHKFVVMHAFGVGDSFDNLNFLMRFTVQKSSMKIAFTDHAGTEHLLRAEDAKSELKWVCVRPVMLAGGPRKSIKVLGQQGQGVGFMPSITRASVAAEEAVPSSSTVQPKLKQERKPVIKKEPKSEFKFPPSIPAAFEQQGESSKQSAVHFKRQRAMTFTTSSPPSKRSNALISVNNIDEPPVDRVELYLFVDQGIEQGVDEEVDQEAERQQLDALIAADTRSKAN